MNRDILHEGYDVVILGAGAAGLMCAAVAAEHGKRVLLLDHADKAGKKILISGGGRCNFTNLYTSADNFISKNPHFCKSALSRFTQYDTIEMFDTHGITWHEREHGQLFCDGSAKQVVDMLLHKCAQGGVQIKLGCEIQSVTKDEMFIISTNLGDVQVASLVVATGGLSIPKMGATALGYDIARQFGLNMIDTEAGLVPFRLTSDTHQALKALAGISLPVTVHGKGQAFSEAMLFTHRGISGPVVLQISSYWQAGESIAVNLLPQIDVKAWLIQQCQSRGKQYVRTVLTDVLPKRLVGHWCEQYIPDKPLQSLTQHDLDSIAEQLHTWQLKPAGTEGYRTAEVTVGGVDTACLSSKTMQARDVKGLYFIGEVVDVTGHLGGFNFQWAWASGYAAGSSL